MKILFWGDLAATGFGSVTMDLGRALLDQGHDLRFISQSDLGQLAEPFASRTLALNDREGWFKLREAGIIALFDGTGWADGWTPEASIVLGDFFAVREVVLANADTRAAFASVPTLHYAPIEGVDLPPAWREMWEVVAPVAMSEFGADQIAFVTGSRPPVIYHGVDSEQFRPVSQQHPLRMTANDGTERVLRTRAECKALFIGNKDRSWSATVRFAEGLRWMLRTDRHMPRKNIYGMLRAVAPVLATRTNLHMILHCRSVDPGGFIEDTKSKYPPFIAQRIVSTLFHDLADGASRNVLTALYNAADVYLSTSAEGFGLTIAEAIACGTPAVGLDYSAVPEVIGPAGLLAPIAGLVDNGYDHFWALPDERKYGPIVASLLDDDVLRKRLGREGPGHVRANFSWSRAAELFAAAIAERQKVAA